MIKNDHNILLTTEVHLHDWKKNKGVIILFLSVITGSKGTGQSLVIILFFVCVIRVRGFLLLLFRRFAKLRISGWEMYFFSIVNINDVDDS